MADDREQCEIEKEERTLSDDRWVRIMADYCADGVWAKDGCAVGDDELPVTEATRERLRVWRIKYDEHDPMAVPPLPFDIDSFCAEGLEIARAVKAELPDWTVIYFDEAKCRYNDNQPREEFEYEVAALDRIRAEKKDG